jgi:hypothetical protein
MPNLTEVVLRGICPTSPCQHVHFLHIVAYHHTDRPFRGGQLPNCLLMVLGHLPGLLVAGSSIPGNGKKSVFQGGHLPGYGWASARS